MADASTEIVLSENFNSNFPKLNSIVIQALVAGQDVALIDIPEILLRMKIAANHTLEELNDIFNQILNKVAKGNGPSTADVAAIYYFPEVFQRPRDDYVASMINTIASDNSA